MHQIQIELEDWEWTALVQMAREIEVSPDHMARKIVRRGMQDRIGRVFDRLVLTGTALDTPAEGDNEAIEHRLGRLFEE